MESFLNLVRIDPKSGRLALAGEDGNVLELIQADTKPRWSKSAKLMKATGHSVKAEDHSAMGAAVREPIRMLARYASWTEVFFEAMPLGPMDDNKIPVDQPIGAALISSPEGRPEAVILGIQQYVRPSWYVMKSKLVVPWSLLKTAGWAVLKRRMEEVGDDLARRRDAKRKALLDVAVAAVAGHSVSVSGGLFTKAAVDNFIKTAAQTGFPITQGTINIGRIMDMTGWTNGSSSALPYFWSNPESSAAVYKTLYHEGYGNVRWRISHSHPMDEIYFGGEPSDIGYNQSHGEPETVSGMDIDLSVDKHLTSEEHADYIGNNYNLWKMTITA